MLLVLALGRGGVRPFCSAATATTRRRSWAGHTSCPMHPEFTANAPRECSICGMALVKAGLLARENAASNESESGEEGENAIAAAQLLTKAASGVATSLLTYNATPVAAARATARAVGAGVDRRRRGGRSAFTTTRSGTLAPRRAGGVLSHVGIPMSRSIFAIAADRRCRGIVRPSVVRFERASARTEKTDGTSEAAARARRPAGSARAQSA